MTETATISTPAAPTSTPAATATETPAAVAPAAPWYSGLPQDLAADPTLQTYTSQEAAMRGLVAARKMIGEQPENLLKLPTAGDADGLRSVLHKLGLPETPDAYTLQPVEGIAHDTDLAKAFTSAAFDAGILPQHAQAVFEKVGGFLKEFEAQQAQAVQNREHADMQALTAKFGSALDDTLARAEAVANHYGVTDAINEAGLGTNPAIVGLLSSVWPTIQEDSVGGRRDSSMGSVKTPEQYMAEARELQRQALSETVRSRQLELSTAASRLYQLANASRR